MGEKMELVCPYCQSHKVLWMKTLCYYFCQGECRRLLWETDKDGKILEEEEKLLRNDELYNAYKIKVRFRLFPLIY